MSTIKIDGEFYECEACRAKPGSPTLCESCLHNRAVIGRLQKKGSRSKCLAFSEDVGRCGLTAGHDGGCGE